MTLRDVWNSTGPEEKDMQLAVAPLGCDARSLVCNHGEVIVEDDKGKRTYYVLNGGIEKAG